ncbi:MAG: hypothetical protein Q9227_006991 [Pyrenula ochraceoflavens]
MASSTTSPNGLNGDLKVFPKPVSTVSRQSSMQNVNTTVPLTITPASARSHSSTAPSPSLASIQSIQSSPEALVPRSNGHGLPTPGHFELPESVMSIGHGLNGEGVVSPTPSKSPNLLRKVSNGARRGIESIKRRQSSSNQARRDQSSGPLTRRRSDSKTGTTSSHYVSDLSHEEEDEEAVSDGLGIQFRKDSTSTKSEREKAAQPVVGTAPVVPQPLQIGVVMTKVSKGKRESFLFVLDDKASRVTWHSKLSKQLYIDDIRDIRNGDNARNYQEEFGIAPDERDRWFTIIYTTSDKSRQVKALHLIAPTSELAQLWTKTLDDLEDHRVEMMRGFLGSKERESVINTHWKREMEKLFPEGIHAGQEECLDLQAISRLCRSLHVNTSTEALEKQFRNADASQTGTLNYAEFRDFLRRLKERQDLKEIYMSLLGPSGLEEGLKLQDFLHFLETVQGINVNADPGKWESEFERLVSEAEPKGQPASDLLHNERPTMKFAAFASFLASDSCKIYSHPSPPPEGQFDRPLNEYFISSSHNTYLQGRQVAGQASTEAYISALRHRCRCIEIDCWDGSDGRPMVLHGRTMTKAITFQDCISVINQYAFQASTFPLIISLEVHCNPEQQSKMVQIMLDTFGNKLVRETINGNHETLPTPMELQNKILIKVKTSEPVKENSLGISSIESGRRRSASSPNTRPAALDVNLTLNNLPPLSSPPTMSPPVSAGRGFMSPAQSSVTATSASEESDAPLEPVRKKSKPEKITKTLGCLGVYLSGFKYRSWNQPESTKFNHCYSYAESAANRLCSHPHDKHEFEKHNVRFFARVYPKQTRLSSSNFDPNIYWRRGVQMVALNWQTYDDNMQINQAMFAAGNDRSGYVLKPKGLRNHLLDRPRLEKTSIRFSVNMISAQQLPRLPQIKDAENISPFIEIQMFSAEDKTKGIASGRGGHDVSAKNGMSGIGSPYRMRTQPKPNNGYNPRFDELVELSLETRYPELVFVRWVVWSSPDGRNTNPVYCTKLASFTAKLSSLQQGYRHLPLYNGNGEEFIFSTLFCKIKKEEPIIRRGEHHDELLEELRSDRASILRSIGQFTKRTLSSDREKKSQDEERRQLTKQNSDKHLRKQDSKDSVRTKY